MTGCEPNAEARAARRTARAAAHPHLHRALDGDGRASPQHLIELADRPRRAVARRLPLRCPTSRTPAPFLRWAVRQDIRVLLPVSREDGLLDWAPYDGDDEELDILGMPDPDGELLGPIAINDVDLILVPAACRRPHRHAAGLGPRLLRQDPRIDGEMPAGLCCDLRRRARRPVPTRTPRPAGRRRRHAERHRRLLSYARRSLERLHAHLLLSLHRVRQRLRHPAGLHRRLPHRVPDLRRQAAQAVQRRRRDLQRLGLLPQRLARGSEVVVVGLVVGLRLVGSQARPRRPRLGPRRLRSSASDDEGDRMLKGFKEFILRGNVIDLAVAVVIGAAFTAIVNALVDRVFNPVIGACSTRTTSTALPSTSRRLRRDGDAVLRRGDRGPHPVPARRAVVYFALVCRSTTCTEACRSRKRRRRAAEEAAADRARAAHRDPRPAGTQARVR